MALFRGKQGWPDLCGSAFPFPIHTAGTHFRDHQVATETESSAQLLSALKAMTPIKIGTTTKEITDIVSFIFSPPGNASGPGPRVRAVLQANYRDGTSALTEGDEAVTLKVLLSSQGIRQLGDSPSMRPQAGSVPARI